MFTTLRKRLHLTPATAIAALALVFAMTGGAYAAGKYVITSTKQISPKVLKSLTGKAGAAGKPGVNGTTGPAGAAGAKGDTGAQGAPGSPGTPGTPGKDGKEGKEGSPWTAGGVLPSGKTETGTWTAQAPEGPETFVISPISFNIPLESSLDGTHVFFVEPENTTHEAECPGSVEAPEAEPGDLCVYAKILGLLPTSGVIHNPNEKFSTSGAGSAGAFLTLVPENTEGGFAYGTWAVTAP